MQSANTTARRGSVITDLTAKRQALQNHLEQLRTGKHSLALDANLGDTSAQKRLSATAAEVTKLPGSRQQQ